MNRIKLDREDVVVRTFNNKNRKLFESLMITTISYGQEILTVIFARKLNRIKLDREDIVLHTFESHKIITKSYGQKTISVIFVLKLKRIKLDREDLPHRLSKRKK